MRQAFPQFQYLTVPLGTTDSGFRGEVEAEQSLQRGERLLAMIESYEHHDLRGPAAPEAEERLTNLQRSRAYTGSVVTDPRRLRRIIRSEDPRIYLGHFVTCVYNPDKALCRRQLAPAGDPSRPTSQTANPCSAATSHSPPTISKRSPTSCINSTPTSPAQISWRPSLPTVSPSSAAILLPYSTLPLPRRTSCDRPHTSWRRRCARRG